MSDSSSLVLFWMTCGCVRTYEELEKRINPYKCPCSDKGIIDSRTTECIECNKRFPFSKLGAVPRYCPACKEKLGIRTRPKSSDLPIHSDPYISGHPNAIASAEREDCIYRLECLDEYWTRIDKQFLPCLGCQKYISRKEQFYK